MSAVEVQNTESPEVQVEQVQSADLDKPQESESSVLKYVLIAVLSIALIMLLYYAYCNFVDNSNLEEPACNNEELDEAVMDFNLREAIQDLQDIQRKVMKTLSETSNI